MMALAVRRFLLTTTATVLLLATTVVRAAVVATPTYYAEIAEIPGTDSGVTGKVVVFANGASSTGYAGIVTGLAASLNSAGECTATNGCGVHIHNGLSCETTESQGGHYFEDPVTADPWVEARYVSDASGATNFKGVVDMGTDDVEGRAFVVHAEDGSRLGCGLLKSVPGDDLLVVKTDSLTDDSAAGVTSSNTVFAAESMSCFFGSSTTLEPSLVSFLNNGGTDCNVANGCGVHIHSGTDCANSTVQGGHLYNADTLAEDPWALIGYESTDAEGSAHYTGCVETGVTDFKGRAFIVHAQDGSRVSCGVLAAAQAATGDDDKSSKTSGSPVASSPKSTMILFVSWCAALVFWGL